MTAEVTRRDAVKLAAALAVGAGLGTAGSALGQQASKPADAAATTKPADAGLARAKQSPEGYMLSEPQVLTLDTDGASYDLIITSVRDETGNRVDVYVPSRSVRIFRADQNQDDFTRQGGLYWRFRDKPGKVMLKLLSPDMLTQLVPPGQLVMVVREDETVRLYTMFFDMRC
jgi:hypothetical protein